VALPRGSTGFLGGISYAAVSLVMLGFPENRWFHSATLRIARSPVSLKIKLYGLN
jgi:hypothetical protein